MNPPDIWISIQEELKNAVGVTSYETWLAAVSVSQINDNRLVIGAPDEFFKNWIEEHYRATILNLLTRETSTPLEVEFTVTEEALPPQTADVPRQVPKEAREEDSTPTSRKAGLNDRFTFDNFVIGPSNRFSCAASQAVAESPAKAYNPLFIYGQVGLGKTHLIQAITHKIRQLHPRQKIVYMSSERFTNELIDAIRTRSTVDFRKKYREIDVLLIDDVQFIAGKESTQEEFFHTFNNLHNGRKQIIITSDRPPKEIANLEERLSSRFAWGLITDIQPPDFETRVAILKKKIELEQVFVPEDVILFIAEQIKTNIRELEGALIRVSAFSILEESPITLDLAKKVLKDMVKETCKTISIEMVQKTVAEFFHVSVADLRAKRRNRNIVIPRQMAMYLARNLTQMSFPEIGNAFGGKDHTTVLHSCKKIEREKENNSDVQQTLSRLITILQK